MNSLKQRLSPSVQWGTPNKEIPPLPFPNHPKNFKNLLCHRSCHSLEIATRQHVRDHLCARTDGLLQMHWIRHIARVRRPPMPRNNRPGQLLESSLSIPSSFPPPFPLPSCLQVQVGKEPLSGKRHALLLFRLRTRTAINPESLNKAPPYLYTIPSSRTPTLC